MHFIDEAKIYLKSGDGGNGCIAFRREANAPNGGPNGGNGGNGGDIILKAITDLNTLIDYRYSQHFRAQNGEQGKGSLRDGKYGNDIVLNIPIGTQIFLEDGVTMIADVMENSFERVLLKGGDGGFGNTHYKSSTNRAPRKSTPGWKGQDMWVWLKLKLISDVGLVGLPNAGKSTFLAATTRAKPKIADYPFTTLKPQLGVAYIDEKEFVISDIPGLIEGASEGHGLGHRFLKHVERCRVILHLVDGTDENFLKNYAVIRKELRAYSDVLADKEEVVVLNKIDSLTDEEIAKKVKSLQRKSNFKVIPMSGVTGAGTVDVLRKLLTVVEKYKEMQEPAEEIKEEVQLDEPEENN